MKLLSSAMLALLLVVSGQSVAEQSRAAHHDKQS